MPGKVSMHAGPPVFTVGLLSLNYEVLHESLFHICVFQGKGDAGEVKPFC